MHLVREQIDQAIVDVVAAEKGVATSRQHLVDITTDLQHRHVEGASTKVVYDDLLGKVAPVDVREGGGGRLVEDAQHL